MKIRFLWLIVLTAVFFISTVGAGFCQDKAGWEQEFRAALKKGKEVAEAPAEGLAYTPSEETVLKKSVKKALNQQAPSCQCMKIAVDYDYNPYQILTSIYSVGENKVELDELCMCASEQGIMKEVIAKAAADAVSPAGGKVFSRDEIAQSQCMQAGLPYTATSVDLPDPPEAPDPIVPDSVARP